MKKKYAPLYLILFIIFVLAMFVIFNQIDSPPPKNINKDDLLPVGLDGDNGFYRLWALSEAAGVDIGSESTISKFREQTFDYNAYKKQYKQWGRGITQTRVTSPHIRDLWHIVQKNRQTILEQVKRLSFLLDRYQQLIDSERVEDFTYIQKQILQPDFQALFNIGKFYTAVKFLSARDGDWQLSVDACLQQVEFCKKLIKSSRTLDANRMAKILFRFVLRSLVALADAPGCPSWVPGQILKCLEPIKLDHFGSRNALICEYFFFETWMESFKGHFRTNNDKRVPQFMLLFFQENRTKRYYVDFLIKVRQQEELPPYKWLEPIPPLDLQGNNWWWLQNMSGKILFDILFFPDLSFHVNDSYVTLALYRLTRLAMEFRASDDKSGSFVDRLRGLTHYSLIDPFSGKPFRWKLKDDGLILYCIGTNLEDDGGVDTVQQPLLDIAVILRR